MLAGCNAARPEAGEASPTAAEPTATATATPTPSPTPTSPPTPAPTPATEPPPPPSPVRIRLGAVKAIGSDNAILFDARERRPEQRAARRAAQAATTRLERYVSEAFVHRRTRTTATPFRSFLDGDARVTAFRAAKRALGRLSPRIQDVEPLRGRANATVLMDGAHAVNVALRYKAVLEGRGARDQRVAIVQRGTAVLAKPAQTWRAEALNVNLIVRGLKAQRGER